MLTYSDTWFPDPPNDIKLNAIDRYRTDFKSGTDMIIIPTVRCAKAIIDVILGPTTSHNLPNTSGAIEYERHDKV